MARVLGACRQSSRGEESISIENQKKRISQWAEDHEHRVVSFTVDRETSGKIPAVKREELGPWLTDPDKIAQWDILATAKLDRGFRSVLDFAQTREWAEERGKKLVSVSEGYDLTTPEGELMANQLVAFAQFERKRAATRRGEAAGLIALDGRWGGGRYSYGYTPHGRKGNYRLVQDRETAPIAKRMVRDSINGVGDLTLAKNLNAEGILSPRGKKWTDVSVNRVLVSPALMGYSVKWEGKGYWIPTIRRDSKGDPVQFTDEPLITEDEWNKLKAARQARSKGRVAPQARHLLYRAAFCLNCSAPYPGPGECEHERPCRVHDVSLYGCRRLKHAKKGSYYICRQCGYTLNLPALEDRIASEVTEGYGRRKLMEKAVIPGDDFATEIARLQRKAERLRAELDEDYDADIEHAVAATEERIKELRKRPHKKERVAWVRVAPEITVAENWERQDASGRNRFLRDYGFAWWLGEGDTAERTRLAFQGTWVPRDADEISPTLGVTRELPA